MLEDRLVPDRPKHSFDESTRHLSEIPSDSVSDKRLFSILTCLEDQSLEDRDPTGFGTDVPCESKICGTLPER